MWYSGPGKPAHAHPPHSNQQDKQTPHTQKKPPRIPRARSLRTQQCAPTNPNPAPAFPLPTHVRGGTNRNRT
jgi:hypothetical protein